MHIQLVESDCSRIDPSGRGEFRSNSPILSIPRKPPSKILFPCSSFRFTHQVKFTSSFMYMVSRNFVSAMPVRALSTLYTFQVPHAWTGGFTSEKAHSYAGSCPLGCIYHSCVSRVSCCFEKSGSMSAKQIL